MKSGGNGFASSLLKKIVVNLNFISGYIFRKRNQTCPKRISLTSYSIHWCEKRGLHGLDTRSWIVEHERKFIKDCRALFLKIFLALLNFSAILCLGYVSYSLFEFHFILEWRKGMLPLLHLSPTRCLSWEGHILGLPPRALRRRKSACRNLLSLSLNRSHS